MIPTFIKSYTALAAVAGYRIVAFADAANDTTVQTAAANTDPVLGVSDRLGADAGQMLDVHRGGLLSVQLGGAVNAGDPLTSDADGKAIAAVAAAGTTVRIVGYADEPGIADDVVDFFFAPGILHQA
ncbi:capsid cement protein [uncultured Tateyamaria sp.]|uniref:capsid cement protein n=1 Tax=uncultured Tateyamaria sp. TaxID=455651 RepID=UPI00262420F0|nr:capsid cement protein [uncultured Tateyamaria sp.]